MVILFEVLFKELFWIKEMIVFVVCKKSVAQWVIGYLYSFTLFRVCVTISKRKSRYSKEDLDTAVRKVHEEGISINQASKQYEISKETLRWWANDSSNPSCVGSRRFTSVRSDSEQEMLVDSNTVVPIILYLY